MHVQGEPYCQICGNADNITLLAYSPKHTATKRMPFWQSTSVTRDEVVTPLAYYRCAGGSQHMAPHESWVDVSEEWQPPAGLPIRYFDA